MSLFSLKTTPLEIECIWSQYTTRSPSLKRQLILKFLLWYWKCSILLITKKQSMFSFLSHKALVVLLFYEQFLLLLFPTNNGKSSWVRQQSYLFLYFCQEQALSWKFQMWATNHLHKEFFCKVTWPGNINIFFSQLSTVCKVFSIVFSVLSCL